MRIRDKNFNSNGFTLVEVLITMIVVALVVAGLMASYLVIQRSWRGGSKQIIVQGQVRIALNYICREIREAADMLVENDGKTLTLTLFNADPDAEEEYIRFAYDETTRQIDVYPEWPGAGGKWTLIHNAWPQPGRELFDEQGKMCYVRLRVVEPNVKDGYQGIDLLSAARSRNMDE